MIKEGKIVTALSWVKTLLMSTKAWRKKQKAIALKGLLYRGGKITDENAEFINGLENNCEFIGFIPNIQYIMEKGDEDDLKSLWIHPFSVPTLLYKVKDKPMLIVTNANLDYNDSVLSKIRFNETNSYLKKLLSGIRGING